MPPVSCPSCRRENPEDAAFCNGCGARLALICPACSRSNSPDAAFCNGCGHRLAAEPPCAPSVSASAPAAPAATDPPARPSFAGGRYTVQHLLGEGGRKRVYLARDQSLGRDVAVSEIKAAGIDDPGQLRVRHEAEAMAKLGDHANIVTVFDIGDEDGQLFIVCEFMAGGDVEGRLREAEGGRLSIDEALRIAGEVCASLEHAHRQGIIHRDLKPGNIWLRQDGSAALGDFGLALSEDRSRVTQEGMMVGTVAYMPPEQALGRPPDARSDLYALGVSLYEMVAGRTPFGGDDAVSIISQHINTPPVAPSWHNREIPKPLDDLILKLLAKDPAQRPQTAAEVGRTLEALTGASTVSPAAEPASANPLERLASGIFVGREKELQQLRSGVDATLSGKGRIVFLVGEPGIGKTRTSEEISTYAGLRGAQVLWGRCYEGEGAPTYWPWVQIVRSYVGDRDPAALLSEMGGGASVIADVVSEVRERLPGLQPAAPLGAEEARFRLFDTLTSFFKNASRQHPLVLILDDLHWADKPSLMLLQFLGRELSGSRILVVGTYRDVELGRRHPLADALAELSRAELSQRVLLRGIEERDVARFMELSSGREAPASLVTAVYRETEGNPFFVQEVVQLLAADGRLDDPKTSGTWSVAIPQGIREAIGRRLNLLSDDCNELLAVASVIGREFDLAMLEKVSDQPGDRVVELLDEALAARVIEEMAETPGRYRFSHALVKETLHDELNTTRRVRLHRKIGETLEAIHGERVEPQLAALAYHFAEGAHAGGDVDKAIAYSRRAGERATALMAHEDAIPHYERALQMLDLQGGADPQQRCDMLLALAWAHNYGGDADEAVAKMEAAVPIARKLDDPRRLALVAASYGFAEFARNLGRPHPGATAVLEEARNKLGNEDTIERAQVTTQLGLQLVLGATAERGGELLSEAIEIARRIDHKPTLVEAIFNGLWSIWRAEDMDRRTALAHEMLELAEEIGNTDRMLEAHIQLFHVLYGLGDFEGCRRQDAAIEELASRTQNARAMYWHHLHRAMWAIVAGDLEKAEHLAAEALAFGTRVWNYVAENQYGAQFSSIRTFQGRSEEMAGLLDAFVEQHHQIAWLAAGAYAHAAVGNEEAARRYLDPFLADDFASMTPDGNWPAGMCLLGQAVYELGDAEVAPRLYELLLPYADLLIFAGGAATPLSPGHRVLGLLAHTMGRLDDALAHFDRASELMRQWGGIRPVEARMGLEFARLLLERKAAGDAERALRILNESIDGGRDIGAPSLVEAALSLKLETQGIDAARTNLSIYAVAHSVQARRPDLVDHAAPDGSVTLMFSDMEGFTSMTERLGDEAAHALIREHNQILRDQIESHGGREVDSQGDGFLVAFKTPRDGVRAAVALQRAFTAYCEANPEEPVRVRVGLHTGQAIRDAEKFFGRTVIMACRIADQARATEILVSGDVRDAVEGEFPFGDQRELTLKGFSGTHAAHTVAWA